MMGHYRAVPTAVLLPRSAPAAVAALFHAGFWLGCSGEEVKGRVLPSAVYAVYPTHQFLYIFHYFLEFTDRAFDLQMFYSLLR